MIYYIVYWLGDTDFGRTLYACNYFINKLVFDTDSFDIAPKYLFFNPNWHDPVKSMIGYIPVIREQSSINSLTHVVRIKNSQLFGTIAEELEEGNNWRLKNMDVELTFEVIDIKSGDPIDPISTFLNKHRDAFPQLIPSFERLRQLLKLFYSLDQLKQSGYLK